MQTTTNGKRVTRKARRDFPKEEAAAAETADRLIEEADRRKELDHRTALSSIGTLGTASCNRAIAAVLAARGLFEALGAWSTIGSTSPTSALALQGVEDSIAELLGTGTALQGDQLPIVAAAVRIASRLDGEPLCVEWLAALSSGDIAELLGYLADAELPVRDVDVDMNPAKAVSS